MSSVDNFGRKLVWYQSLFGITKGYIGRIEDITKINRPTCLYALSFIKEKAEVESKNIKSKFNR